MKIISFVIFTFLHFGCNSGSKGEYADNRGKNPWDNDSNYPNPNDLPKEKLLSIINENMPKQEASIGGSTDVIEQKTLMSYDDTTCLDTIFATLKIKGYKKPPAIGNPPPNEPFERIETYKLFKVESKWKAENQNTIENLIRK